MYVYTYMYVCMYVCMYIALLNGFCVFIHSAKNIIVTSYQLGIPTSSKSLYRIVVMDVTLLYRPAKRGFIVKMRLW